MDYISLSVPSALNIFNHLSSWQLYMNTVFNLYFIDEEAEAQRH